MVVKQTNLQEKRYLKGHKSGVKQIYFILSLINQFDTFDENTSLRFEMHYSDIKRMLNTNKRVIRSNEEVFEMLEKLSSVPMYWHSKVEEGLFVLLPYIKYDKKTGIYNFTLNDDIKPYLLELKRNVTTAFLNNFIHLKRSYSFDLYLLLKGIFNNYSINSEVKEAKVSIDEIRMLLGITDKYDTFFELKRWILIPTNKEINDYTDISFSYKIDKNSKRGKKITNLFFDIWSNKTDESEGEEEKETKQILVHSPNKYVQTSEKKDENLSKELKNLKKQKEQTEEDISVKFFEKVQEIAKIQFEKEVALLLAIIEINQELAKNIKQQVQEKHPLCSHNGTLSELLQTSSLYQSVVPSLIKEKYSNLFIETESYYEAKMAGINEQKEQHEAYLKELTTQIKKLEKQQKTPK